MKKSLAIGAVVAMVATCSLAFMSGCQGPFEPGQGIVADEAETGSRAVTALTEHFETGTKTSYATAKVSLSSGSWTFTNALLGTSTSDRKNGAKSARVTATGKITMAFDKTGGAGTVTLYHARFGSDASATWALYYSTDQGSSWTKAGETVTSSSTSLVAASFTVNAAGSIRFEVRKLSGTGRLNFDDFSVSDYSAVVSTLSATPTSASFTAAGGLASVAITSNVDWTAVSSASWLGLSASSGSGNGTLTMTASANAATSARTATVTLSGAGVSSVVVSVSQAAAASSLSATPTSASFAAAGGSSSVTVASNVAWTAVSSASWLTLSASSGSGNGTLAMTAAANAATSARTATVTLSGTGVGNVVVAVSQAAAGLPSGSVKLRIVAGNLSSGSDQSYTGGQGIRILQGVAPDVVLIQEFNYASDTDSDFQAMANTIIYGSASGAADGTQAYWYREGKGGVGAAASIPNGIISKYPFKTDASGAFLYGEWDDSYMSDRDFVWACIDIPGSVDLYAVSLHIKASSGSTNVTKRKDESTLLKSFVAANVPGAAYITVGGDFNTYSMTESCYGVLDDFLVIPTSAVAVDQAGDADTNSGRSSPYDHVFADADLGQYAVPVVVGGHSFANGLVVDTRVTSPYSIVPAISPALSTDSGATSMQHMAIVRDFSVPVSE